MCVEGFPYRRHLFNHSEESPRVFLQFSARRGRLRRACLGVFLRLNLCLESVVRGCARRRLWGGTELIEELCALFCSDATHRAGGGWCGPLSIASGRCRVCAVVDCLLGGREQIGRI